MRILLLYVLVWLLLWRLTVCCSAYGSCAAVPLCLLQVNFEKVWDEMQSPLVSLVSGVPQTLSNEKWLEMYSYVALFVSLFLLALFCLVYFAYRFAGVALLEEGELNNNCLHVLVRNVRAKAEASTRSARIRALRRQRCCFSD